MCGRFWQGTELGGAARQLRLESFKPSLSQNFNLAPSQNASVIVNQEGLKVVPMRFGLVPHWAKDLAIGNKMINARAETITEKITFKKLLLAQRCLIPCNGYYEWKQDKGRKRPFLIRMRSHEPFYLAGIWSEWKSFKDETVYSFAIITTEANALMRKIHHRMPVIMPGEQVEYWLDPANHTNDQLVPLLKPFAADKMEAYEVSTFVNIPGHNSQECIKPLPRPS